MNVVHGVGDVAGQGRLSYLDKQVAEELTVLGAANGLQRRAEKPDFVFVEHTGVCQGHGQVEARLPAQGG